MLIIGLQVPAYDIAGARITTQAILDTQLRACIKFPSSCTILTHKQMQVHMYLAGIHLKSLMHNDIPVLETKIRNWLAI